MEIIMKPWPHIIIDDYYPQPLFDDMRKEFERFYLTLDLEQRKRSIVRGLQDSTFLFPAASKCVKARPLTVEMLSEFVERRVYSPGSLKLDVELSILTDSFDYKRHFETWKKVLSAVTYVDPDNGIGTVLYESEDGPPIEVEWRPNRTLIFAGIDDKTWHSYKCNDGDRRITINSFLNRPHLR